MPQFLIPSGKKVSDTFPLSIEESHHLRDVRRIKVGEPIHLSDGHGKRFLGKITTLSSREVVVSILEEKPPEIHNGHVTIAQSLLKKDKMEWVIEKCAELGVDELIPFTSSRTIVQLKNDSKTTRWEKIVESVVKQCGRSSFMKIHTPISFHELLKVQADLKIICWEESDSLSTPIGSILKKHLSKSNTSLLAVIGPEGGLPEQEVDLAKKAGFHVASLGPRILRAETAAVAVTTLIQYELDNL